LVAEHSRHAGHRECGDRRANRLCAAATSTIRVGAAASLLPTIPPRRDCEQFGTLESL